MLVDGDPVSASLFDFGLFFFHNAERLVERGSGPYFYLPKLESHLEARLWDHVFNEAEGVNGLAVRESFFVSFLGGLGVDPSLAFATGFLFFVVTVTLSIPGAIVLGWEHLRPSAGGEPAGAPRPTTRPQS